MQDLARALGVGRATLHRHFSTRDELIREIAREATVEAMARVEQARIDEGLADAALDRLVHGLVPMGDRFHFLLSEPSLFGLQSSTDPVMVEFAQAELEIRAAIVSLIERGKREGLFRLDVPTGWAVSASFAAVAVGSLLSAALAARAGRKWPTAGALAVAAIGLGLLAAALDIDASYRAILIAMLVLGVGLGVAQAVTTDAIMSAASERLGARAAAINDAALQFGAAFGVAVLGTVFNTRYRAALDQADITATLPDAAREGAAGSLAGALQTAEAIATAGQPITAAALADASRDAS